MVPLRATILIALRALCLAVAGLGIGWALPAQAAVCSNATSQGTTGPTDWETYCWLDFAGYNDTTARTVNGQTFSYTLPDGAILTFRVKVSGTALVAKASPSWKDAAVGNTAFLGIGGDPILYQTAVGGSTTITILNISLTPPAGGVTSSYMFVAADAESTNNGESIQYTTNGDPWEVLGQIGPTSGNNYPTISGAGTTTFTETGVAGIVGAYIVGSNAAKRVDTVIGGTGLQGVMFAIRFASITLNTVITGARADAADQFTYSIAPTAGGAAFVTQSSSGTGMGPFTAATLTASAAQLLTLNQTMASGSVNTISHYRSTLTCTNANAASTTPLPTGVVTTSYNFGVLQFGDKVACTFTERPFPHLTLTKTLGTGGRQFAGDQFTMQVLQGATVVAATTTAGTGTTLTNASTPQYQGTVNTTYSFAEQPAGTTVLAQYSSTLVCTNANSGSTTSLPTTVGGSVTPKLGDVIACTLRNTKRAANATLAVLKTSSTISDPLRGTTNPLSIPGAIVRYAIQVNNSGSMPVDVNTVFMVDRLPGPITVGSAATPTFTNGTPSSGLTFNPVTDIAYSTSATAPASYAACNYTPVAAYDPAITFVCINPKGTMAGSTGTPPSFTVTFNAQIK